MLADFVLVLHVGVVLFNVGGMLAIALGGVLRWRWVRAWVWRALHLASWVLVAVQALIGVYCPLTLLEDHLRGETPTRSFVARWLHQWLYWDAPLWAFGVGYVACLCVVLALWRWVPPRKY
jgi:hypothetical protein